MMHGAQHARKDCIYRATQSSLLVIFFSIAISITEGYAQDIVDGFTRGSGNTDIALSLMSESYNQFWVGQEEMDLPPPLGTISTTSMNLFIAHGITNEVDIVASLPYISSSADGDGSGPPDQSDYQDGTLMVKWRPWHQTIGESASFDLTTAVGIHGPLTDYVVNAPVAIGHGSTNVELRAIGLFRLESGPFASVSLGYSRRDGIVPDAAISGFRLGYTTDKIYAEGWLFNQNSQGGTTIGEGIPFQSNGVDYMRAGVKGAYSITDWLGISVGGWTTLDGKNVGKATGFGGGIIVQMDELHRTIIGN
ncbi:MAG: hypothetical protein KDD67_17465 [Ignavibacteriae bacterium]|nr:hypothetical protein [Ignavibacteriota bacterium]MCB9217456.1 hypothetical protein [Ignavibacteria bacterium]